MTIRRISYLTCGLCMEIRRVKTTLSAEGEHQSSCFCCGATSWLNLPKLAPQEITRTWEDSPDLFEVWAREVLRSYGIDVDWDGL